MKKFLLSLLAMMIVAVAGFAQTSLLATLSHEGTVKTYYGASALKSAYADATHGDVITLSSGTFLATNISKAITVCGAGMDADSLSLREPTIITGDFTINIADSVAERLTIEGIYHNHTIKYQNVNQPMFLKCRFNKITYYSSSSSWFGNASFIHCKIGNIVLCNKGTASFLSCAVNDPQTNGGCVAEFVNCVIWLYNTSDCYLYNSTIKNSFLYSSYDYKSISIDNSCTMFNNIGCCKYYSTNNLFANSPNSSNKMVSSLSSVFKTWTGVWNDEEKFELTDEAKTTYLGTDGTQIGIYGGNLPFESTPSNPQITKCNVAAKSTADGKLSVDITIKSAE